jgi:hypothetical protein
MSRATCESTPALDVRAIVRRGLFRPNLEFPWSWYDGAGKPVHHVNIHVEESAPLVSWRTHLFCDETRLVWAEQRVRLEWTECYFGGKRPWLICDCDRRSGVLYMGRDQFACRDCSGLTYNTQLLRPWPRSIERARNIRMRLVPTSPHPSLTDRVGCIGKPIIAFVRGAKQPTH